MSMLPALLLTLTMAVLITVVPRIVYSWLQFSELAANENKECLQALLRQENEWVMRHFVCASSGVALVVIMKTIPNLVYPEQLPALTTGYVMISFTFALAESLLAQKIVRQLRGVTALTKLS